MSQILTLVFPKSFVQRRKTLFVIFNLFLLFEGNTCNFTFIKCFIPASKDQCNVEIYSPRVILPLIQRQLPKGVSIKCWRKSVVLQKNGLHQRCFPVIFGKNFWKAIPCYQNCLNFKQSFENRSLTFATYWLWAYFIKLGMTFLILPVK